MPAETPPVSPPAPATPLAQGQPNVVSGQAQSLPPNTGKSVEGEVVALKNDGTVNIRTDDGEVIVKVDARAEAALRKALARARNALPVKIDIAANRQTIKLEIQQPPARPATQTAQPSPTLTRAVATPLNVTLGGPPTLTASGQILITNAQTLPLQPLSLTQLPGDALAALKSAPLPLQQTALQPSITPGAALTSNSALTPKLAPNALAPSPTPGLSSGVLHAPTTAASPSGTAAPQPSPGTAQITTPQLPQIQTQITATLATAGGNITLSSGAQPSPLTINATVTPLPTITPTAANPILSGFAGSYTGTVVGFTGESNPVLQLSQNGQSSGMPTLYKLNASVPALKIGQTVQLLPQTGLPPLTYNAAPVADVLSPAITWDALDALVQSTASVAQATGQNFAALLPGPAAPTQFGGAVMFFIAAMRSGDINSWIGDKTATLLNVSATGKEALTRVGTELARAAGAGETTSSEWRVTPLPLLYGETVHKVTLYTRHDNEGGGNGTAEDDKEKKTVRFLFDLEMSRMGPVQIDGLFQNKEKKRLDIALRTEIQLSTAMRQNIRKIYSDVLEASNLDGDILFQSDPDQWMVITPDMAREEVHV